MAKKLTIDEYEAGFAKLLKMKTDLDSGVERSREDGHTSPDAGVQLMVKAAVARDALNCFRKDW